MPKITVVEIINIGTQLEIMSADQMVEFYKKNVDDHLIIEDFVNIIKEGNKEIPYEDIPELLAINLSGVPGIYFKLGKGTNIFIKNGVTEDKRPIFNQNITFSSIGYRNKNFLYDGSSNLVTFVNFVNYYLRNYMGFEKALIKSPASKDIIASENVDREILNPLFKKACKDLKINCSSVVVMLNIIVNITREYDIFSLNKLNYNTLIDDIISKYDHILEYNNIFVSQEQKKYKNEYLESVVRRKFGNKKFKNLTDKEKLSVESYISIKDEIFKSNQNNKCKHIPLIVKLKKALTLSEKKQILYKLKEFMPKNINIGDYLKKHKLVDCDSCSRILICPHIIELIDTISYTTSEYKINQIMNKYVDEFNTTNGYYCKLCGEHLYDQQSLLLSTGLGAGKPAETTQIEEILWREIRTALNSIRFNISKKGAAVYRIDPQEFIRESIEILVPWLEIVKKKESKSATTTENELLSFLNIYGAAYANILIAVLSSNNNLIEILSPKLGKSPKLNIEIILNHVFSIKAVDIRSLQGRITADVLKPKLTAAYTIMNNLYQKTDTLGNNIVEEFEYGMMMGPILSKLKFSSKLSDILSTNKPVFSYIIVPNYPKDTSIIRFYAETLKDDTWKVEELRLKKIIENNEKLYKRHLKYLPVYNYIASVRTAADVKLNLNRFYDKSGAKNNWNIFVFGDKDYAAKDCIEINDGEKITDLKTKSGNILTAAIKNTNNEELIKIISRNGDLNSFYEKVEFYCPILMGEHIIENDICSKCGFNTNLKVYDADFEQYYDKYKDKMQKQKLIIDDKLFVLEETNVDIKFNDDILIVKEMADKLKIDYNNFDKLLKTEILFKDDTTIYNLIYLIQNLFPALYENIINAKIELPMNEIIPYLLQTLAENVLGEQNIDYYKKEIEKFFTMLKNFTRPEKFTRWDLLSKTTIKVLSKETNEDKVPEVNEFDITPEEADNEDLEVPFANQFDLDNDFDNSDNT